MLQEAASAKDQVLVQQPDGCSLAFAVQDNNKVKTAVLGVSHQPQAEMITVRLVSS